MTRFERWFWLLFAVWFFGSIIVTECTPDTPSKPTVTIYEER